MIASILHPRQRYTGRPSSVNRAAGRCGRRAPFHLLPVNVSARFESSMEGRRCGAPAGDFGLGDPGLVEGHQSQLPPGRAFVSRWPSGDQDRDA